MQSVVTFLILYCCIGVNKAVTETVPCDKEGWIFTCDDGHCIEDNYVCDGKIDCPDGSDEKSFNSSSGGFECTVKSTKNKCLLPEHLVCDLYSHCLEDECDCSSSETFQCSAEECVRHSYFCDGIPHCSDGKDEILYRNKSEGILCQSAFSKYPCVLPDVYKCDGNLDCVTGGDECFCGSGDASYDDTSHFDQTCFRCLDGRGEMLLHHLCNGFFDCPDLSDECLCENPLPICKQISYEVDCEFKCRRNVTAERDICIEKTEVCDGNRNCPLGEDEKYCQFVSTMRQEILEIYSEHMPEFWCCNSGYSADCLSEDTFTNETHNGCDMFYACPPDPYYKPYLNYSIKCDGIPTCIGSFDECLECPGMKAKPNCARSKQLNFRCPEDPVLGPFMATALCDGIANCQPDRPFETSDEQNCTGLRFECLTEIRGIDYMSIPIEKVCDCYKDCNNGADESNCTEYSKFCCRTAGGVPKEVVCNGIEDCQDGSDECQFCIKSPFADDEHLISNIALRVFVWIIGISSSVGNVYVLIESTISLKGKIRNIHGRIMTLYIIALAAADLCVGLYLVALAITETRYSGVYCYEDKFWRSGRSCNALGILSTFGLEASVFIQTAVTVSKLRATLRPFSKPSLRRSLSAILFVLIIAMLLAVIPIIPPAKDYFTSSVRFSKNALVQRTVTRKEMSGFGNRIISYESLGESFENILGGRSTLYSWDSLFKLMRHLNESFVPQQQFGYYSTHGVCLPRLFPTTDDSAWEYSIAISALNFSLFLAIFVSYIILYRTTLNIRKNAELSACGCQRTANMQKKITRIIATDFCCWIPICLIAFVKILGVPISDVVYAVAAIVIVPINSAINPFLYSNMPEEIYSTLRKVFRYERENLGDESMVSLSRIASQNTTELSRISVHSPTSG